MSSTTATAKTEWSTRLAQALIQGGYETEANLEPLMAESLATGQALGTMLISRQILQPGVVVGALSHIAQLPAVDITGLTPSPEASSALPPSASRAWEALALQMEHGMLVVAFSQPPADQDLESIKEHTGFSIKAVLADPTVIATAVGISTDPPVDGGPVSNGSEVPESHAVPEAPQPTDGEKIESLLERGIPAQAAQGGVAMHIDDLLRYAVAVGASDLHLTAGQPAAIRLHGAIRPIEGCPVLANEELRDMVFGILPASQRERFEEESELDTSHSIAGVGRFRVNVSLQRGTVAAALRPIPHEMPEFDTLGLPDSIKAFTELRRGLVLVTGPTGSGKSTTLASLIDIINRTKPLHIVTVEDPIEFLHDHKRSIISQREIGEDTNSFGEALRRVLRQDPDVILVGELRDLETISMALTAAETGHLVFATLHTQDAPQTIDRVIDVFPTTQQEQIRVMLAATLEGVVTQQLIPNTEGSGRVACSEVLVCTSAIRNLIRQAKTHQIYSLMQVGGSFGMQTMDQGLAKMVKEGLISENIAYDRSANEEDLRNHLNS